METETAYTEHGPIQVPTVELKQLPQDCKEVALRGYGYIVAVVNRFDNICYGWKAKSNPII